MPSSHAALADRTPTLAAVDAHDAPANDGPRRPPIKPVAGAVQLRALDSIGRLAVEVARLGEALDRRLERADRHTAEGLAAARADLRALEATVAARLAASAAGHAQAVEAIRSEVSQAVDQLAHRLAAAERSTAGAAEALGARLDALSARMEAAEARLGATLADRLETSERRTQAQLGELVRELAQQAAEVRRIAPNAEIRRRPGLVATSALALAGIATIVALGGAVLQLTRPAGPAAAVQLHLPFLALRPTLPFEIWPFAPAPRARPPRATAPAPPARPPGGAPRLSAQDYSALAQAVAHGDAAALAKARALAEAGAPEAELLIAKLYESGQAGLPRDLVLARQWTERAAEGGERAAMHNLAVYMVNGEGGALDLAGAARWFTRAAEAGVIDAQFNLALLYENGRGVPRNLAAAYRWYSIAANAGDGMARGKAVALEAKLTAHERAAVASQVEAFAPGRVASEPTAPVIAPAASVAQTQQLLSRLGAYVGPTDGTDTPAYRAAVAAYLREHPEVLVPTLPAG